MQVRAYDHPADYELINEFLVDIYRPAGVLANWLQPRWEYLHFHPMSGGLPFGRCGVARDGEEVVGFVHFEDNPAFNYLQRRPGRKAATPALLDWAERQLGGESVTFGRRVLGLYVDEVDRSLEAQVASRGFTVYPQYTEAHALFVIDGPVPQPQLPDGFRLQSLADENDLHKINRVLWRGFNHPGPPPEEEVAGRERAQRAPNFRKDLTIVAVAPNGDYVTFAGMWVVAPNRVAYVEPVATDPDYRRMGLGKAAVLEAIRRAAVAGADVVWVGSDQAFYLDMGFTVRSRTRLWVKPLD